MAAAFTGQAQDATVKAFHPAGPLPAYEVATIKPVDPDAQYAGMTLRRYIGMAYGVPIPWGMQDVEYSGSQVLGGPAWVATERYQITGKPPQELREAMEKMPREERMRQTEMMEQSLLAERFHLKVHFETREMPVFEMVPAKGGLKIAPADLPPQDGVAPKPAKPGEVSPGMTRMAVMNNGATVIDARGTTLDLLINGLRGQSPEIAGKLIVNKTGFTGNFDLKEFRFLGLTPPQHPANSGAGAEPDVPSVFAELEDKLGVKLVPTRAPVEVVVIDSIDRPTEN